MDDVVALADRLARRSESRLTGDEAGHCQDGPDGPDGPDGEEEEEVEQLRMASPFCNGREDSYFSPQDVEIEKDLEDNKVIVAKIIMVHFMSKPVAYVDPILKLTKGKTNIDQLFDDLVGKLD